MKKISLCMIVKNEEKVLSRCLDSVKDLVDEIVIIDTGSSDNTKLIASKYTKKVYDFVWCNDFAKARNFAFSHASCEYIMWLDADDVVPKQSLNKLIELKRSMDKDVYMLKYDISFLNNKPIFSYYRERILRNCDKCIWVGVVHECITLFGQIERLDVSIEHRKVENVKSDRNIKIYEGLKKERELTPREKYYYARELFDHGKYLKSIKQMDRFIQDGNGWVENIIDGYFIKARAYLSLRQDDNAFDELVATFKYDEPRANVCCLIGDYFLNKQRFFQAIYWYNTALGCKDVISKGGFVEDVYYNYYPYLQLCVCYYRLNNIEKSKHFNELAGKYCNSATVISNREFLNNIGV